MSKTRVGIIFGGRSAEHEVSLQSAKNILDALDKARFDVSLIGIDKQGLWHLCDPSDFLLNADDPKRIALNTSGPLLSVIPGAERGQLVAADGRALPQVDVVFPIVHGTLGEDGTLQGLLRTLNLPFAGPGVLGAAAAMDKDVAKRLLRDAGLAVAPFVSLNRISAARTGYGALAAELGATLFVKPANQGSSVGVSKVRNAAEYDTAMALALSFDHKVLVESAISGREIECAVLGNELPEASLCGEVVVHDDFYAYDTKYLSANGAETVIPADIATEAQERIRDIAVRAYQALDCIGMARVDVFLTPAGEVVINELNTLPGFTKISMYPKLWGATGLGYTALITRLIELALERHAADSTLQSSITSA